jgi:exopolysaccharide biosynthesis polyprenyl glycosylphosphotransferase
MSNSLTLKKLFLLLGDIFLMYVSLIITVRLAFLNGFGLKILILHLLPFSIIYFFWLIIFYISGLYDLHLIKTKISFYARTFGAILAGLILGMLFFYTIPFFGITPKTNLILNSLIFGILFIGWRNLFYSLFSIYFLNKVTIIGNGYKVEGLKNEILKRPYLGYKLIPVDFARDLFSQIQKYNIDTVIFTEEFESNPKLLKALYLCLPARINFLDSASAYELITEKIPISTISHAWFLGNLKEGEKSLYDKAKRGFDIILAGFLLIITLPLWVLIALSVKLEDKGPIFYSQERVGKDGKPFMLYKFRSMKVGAEKGDPVWAKRKDERITKVGKFLRETHLDEIPQMINVLKGDINLVGPRPERPHFIEKLEKEIPHYHLRHIIRPGFTGWAQIKFRYGRSIMDSREKFEYDLYYLKNRNFLLDIGILLKTFNLIFRKS